MWNQIKQKIITIYDGMKLSDKFTLLIMVLVFVPITLFAVLFFSNMEKNAVRDGRNSLEYSLERSHDEMIRNVDTITMSTVFFLSDQSLIEYLKKLNSGVEMSGQDLTIFRNNNISSLERMVKSNPNLYQIRVYAESEEVVELAPILYGQEKMQLLSWANDKNMSGWKYNYKDLVSVPDEEQAPEIMALITPITDKQGEQLGVIEVAIEMGDMFPDIFKSEEDDITFFVNSKGTIYCRDEHRDFILEYMQWNAPHAIARQAGDRPVILTKRWKYEQILEGSHYIKELDGVLVRIDNLQEEVGVLHQSRDRLLVVLFVVSIALVYLINFVVKQLLSRFYQVLQSVRDVQSGALDVIIPGTGSDETAELGYQINSMILRIKQLMEDNMKRELIAKDAEIRSLQNQINAHFIYNVLESIKMMAEIDERYDISDAITSLGKLLRYSMKWTSGKVTVGEELEYVKNYLVLINLRFDYEIYLSLNIPDIVMHQEIPKMSLQPIVENAIVHGIEDIAENTNIYVKGTVVDGECIIDVTDCGKGMTDGQVRALHRKINGEIEVESLSASGNGIGLKNVQDRIRINFGEEYGLTISSKLGCYTKVRMKIPQTYFEAKEEKAEEK